MNFVDLIKQYADIDELTQALLNTLIDRIEVHEPEDVDGEFIQKLDVYYKFVGRLDLFFVTMRCSVGWGQLTLSRGTAAEYARATKIPRST